MRSERADPERAVIGFGANIFDLDGYILKKKRNDTSGSYRRIPLSIREFEVLKYLVINERKALSPEKIYNSVRSNRHGDLNAFAVNIRRQRKK